jgi:hypothetical protein
MNRYKKAANYRYTSYKSCVSCDWSLSRIVLTSINTRPILIMLSSQRIREIGRYQH